MSDVLFTPQTHPDRWETVTDAAEGAFTIALPRGWQNRAWTSRNGAAVQVVASSTSPDGATTFFTGDPTIPVFVDPGTMPFGPGPGMVERPGTSIEHFLPGWVQYRFGATADFRIVGMAPHPPLLQRVQERARRGGIPLVWATAGRLALAFRNGDAQVRGLVLGATSSFGGMWLAEVHGITTTGDPEALTETLLGMVASQQTTTAGQQRMAQERAASAASHQATMASIRQNTAFMTATHQQNMANLNASAQSHQANMAALRGAHDASNLAWSERQAASDARHAAATDPSDDVQRRFLETIAEERTVVDGAGERYRVADGYDRYFRRQADGAWIGLQSHQELASVPGIDPRDFEEVKIVR